MAVGVVGARVLVLEPDDLVVQGPLGRLALKSASCEFVGDGEGLLGGADGVEAFGLGDGELRAAVRGGLGPVGQDRAALHLCWSL